jgi:hypothetical protein
MAKLLLLLALSAVFAAAILAGPGSAARQKPVSAVPVATTTASTSSAPVVKGTAVGRMHY